MQIQYRPDIDGLRAVAVVSVLFYHLDFSVFSGGFTGVDIFFVISGYLITSIIVKELAAKRFSFAVFYERRIRRILPAYFFLLVFTTLGGYLIYAPETMNQYGRAMRYSLVFISNLLFAREVDYFDKSFNDSPLLHTWTLSVEEQYYLIWPLILLLAGRYLFHRNFKSFFILLITGSLAISEILTFILPKLSFYMIYSRAWEFGAGAFIALPAIPVLQSKKIVEIMSAIGFGAILVSIFLLHDTLRFPGLTATFSVIGTALIIYSGKHHHRCFIHRMLSIQPLLFIGLISYSLYLWHWPIITFTKYYLRRDLHLNEVFLIILVSLFVAYVSYRFVETPFRKKRRAAENNQKSSGKKIFIITSLIIFCFLQVAKAIERTGGFPSRFPEINQADLYFGNPLRKDCHLSQSETLPKNKEKCSRNYGRKNALIWGDSHANHYSMALDKWARENKVNLRQSTKSACVPLYGDFDIYLLKDRRYEKYESCREFNENIFQLIDKDSIDIVIIGGRWSGYLPDSLTREEEKPGLYLLDHRSNSPSPANTETIFRQNFSKMVAKLREKNVQVILLGQVPVFTQNPIECYFTNITPMKKFLSQPSARENSCEMTRDEINRQVSKSHTFLSRLAEQDGVSFFNPLDEICDESSCRALQNGKIIYRDTQHLNSAGFAFLQKPLADKLK